MTTTPFRILRLFCLLCFASMLVGGCSGTRPGEVIVGRHVHSGVWSRDSRGLYYYKEGSGLCRYDVDTGKRQTYRLPEILEFDVSPDAKRVVFERNPQDIYVADLATGRADRVLATSDEIQGLYWLTDDKIVFTRRPDDYGRRGVYLMDLSDKSVSKLRSKATAVVGSIDGSGFIYVDDKDRYHHYLLSTGKDTILKSSAIMRPHATIAFIYLSRDRAIYNAWGDQDEGVTEVLDLRTTQVRRVTMPDCTQFMGLSPDMGRYWWCGSYHQDTTPVELYLMRVPPETVRQLAESAR